MSTGPDLTRWNRAGLSRFRYVGGNAATHLEVLRQALARRFPEWRELTAGVPKDTDGEAVTDRLDRLLAQVEAKRRDWLWEIGRGLARAAHVLTEHLDAYANEGFLGTATQWDSVRRLVKMLGYHPAPPASASTLLVLEAKDSGVVEKGFKVKHTPPDGGPPVLFETLDDVTVDPALNALRLAGHDRSLEEPVKSSKLTLEGRIETLSIGQPVVLEDESKEGSKSLQARLIVGVDVAETTTCITLSGPDVDLPIGYTRVHLDPADRLEPVGPAVGEVSDLECLQLEVSVNLSPGDVVYISDGAPNRQQVDETEAHAYYQEISGVEGRRINFGEALGKLDLRTAYVSRPHKHKVAKTTGPDVEVAGEFKALKGARVAVPDDGGSLLNFVVGDAQYEESEHAGFTTLTLAGSAELPDDPFVDPIGSLDEPPVLFAPPVGRDFEVDSFVKGTDTAALATNIETEIPKKTSAGDLAVILRESRMAWGRLTNVGVDIRTGQADFSVKETEGWQDTWSDSGGEPFYLTDTKVYGHFRQSARLAGWQKNTKPVSGCLLPLAAAVPEALKKGQKVLLEKQGSAADSREAEVVATEGSSLTLSPALIEDEGFTFGNTVVRANLVLAGHGESRRERILGSGDATDSRASFVLRQEGISHVADSTQPSGVRPDLTLRVEDRIWQQVATLRDSEATDLHYTARQTEEGYVEIAFGDGRSGQRLPTGTNNVRVAFRVGTGLAGNVAAGSLVKAVRPHRLVNSMRQPIAAKGGNEREDVASLRENAPASVLTLERAVSPSDFARLAARHRSLWQASAFVVTHGGEESPIRPDLKRVEVVAVPASGGALGSLEQTIREFLATHTLPGIEVVVSSYESVILEIKATVLVKSAEAEVVLESVRRALFEAFSLRRRKLGQDLFLSEVYAVVEEVSGVESSRCCVLYEGATLLRLPASPRQVIYLDPDDAEKVTLTPQELER